MSTASAYNLWKIKLMPTLKLHYDGWVALPAAVRQQLGFSSGDKLDVALVDGTIVLRLAAKATRPVQNVGPEEAVDPPAPNAIGHAAHPDVAPARRGQVGHANTRLVPMPLHRRPSGLVVGQSESLRRRSNYRLRL